MPRFEREQSEYMEKLVFLNRVSKTVKGGRVAKFSALMVVVGLHARIADLAQTHGIGSSNVLFVSAVQALDELNF